MITYTKKNINFLAFVITVLIFIFFQIISCILLAEKQKAFFSNSIYSSSIPIYLNDTSKKANTQTNTVLTSSIYQTEDIKTRRKYIQENKEIKWRIQIPKLNLDVHIQEGTTSDILLTSVGHFEETNKWKGNVGLAAHNRGYECNFFQNIKNLKLGDEIIYITTNGKKVYKVQTNKIILETDWSYLQKTKDNRITLITCEENRKEYRRCIQAVEIANYVK